MENIHFALGLNIFFHSAINNRKCAYFQKLAIDKCAMAFVPPLAIEKRRNLLTLLRNLQTLAAFIAALTSEKR